MTTRATSRTELDQLAINTIRFLAVDAVEKAKSGHPGMPMGMADAAFVLWTRFLRYQPQDPAWPDRDRFVLSAGHGSMLLYALLHLAGYDLPLAELERFRQLGSKTPGHPEHGLTPGVETTTGPLGQGFGNGVGMAVAGRMLAARFNTPAFAPVTYRVFGIVSDGDLMEGDSGEAASLAGHWGLGNLIYLYDDNHITIEGNTALAFAEDVGKRFEAYGWHVDRANPYDTQAVETALASAVAETERPSLIITRSHIGYGAPHKQDSREAHGEPLGAEEVAGAKRALGWPESPPFLIPDGVLGLFRERAEALSSEHKRWRHGMTQWAAKDSERARLWEHMLAKEVPDDLWGQLLAAAPRGDGATRVHGQAILQKAAALIPSLVGGSADLEPSTRTRIKDSPSIERGKFEGRNFHFGIREHGMATICNGIALAGGFIPYGSSFLVFTDYARPAIRMAALMRQQVIWVITHDSIFLGEDGPTHQPIDTLTSLRALPNLLVTRPATASRRRRRGRGARAPPGPDPDRADAPDAAAIEHAEVSAAAPHGGYVAQRVEAGVRSVAHRHRIGGVVGARGGQASRGRGHAGARRQPARAAALRRAAGVVARRVLPPGGRRVSIGGRGTDYWHRFVGPSGLMIGVDTFGESAPLAQLQEHFGFTPDKVAARVLEWARSAPA
jgi:transketolase